MTRYYGGTDLDVGDLAHTYSRAVKEALDAAGAVGEIPHEWFTVAIGYDDSGNVCRLLEGTGVEFEAAYEANVSFEVHVSVENGSEFRNRIRSATGGRVNAE